MSASAHGSLPTPPPGDEDLRELYAQVWRGFVEEPEEPTPTSAAATSHAPPPPGDDELPGYDRPEHRAPDDFVPDSKKYIPGKVPDTVAVAGGNVVRIALFQPPTAGTSRVIERVECDVAHESPSEQYHYSPADFQPGHSNSDSCQPSPDSIGSDSTYSRPLPQVDLAAPAPPRSLPAIDIDESHDSGTMSGLTMLVPPHSTGSLHLPTHDGGVRVLDNRSPSPAPHTPGQESYMMSLPDPYYASSTHESPVNSQRPRGAGLPAIPGAQTSPTSPMSAYDSPASYYGNYDNTGATPSYTGRTPANGAHGYMMLSTLTRQRPAPANSQENPYARPDSPPSSLERSNTMRSFDSYYQEDGGNGDATDFAAAMMASPHSEYAPYTPVAGPSTRRVSDFERMNAMKLELHDEEYEDDGYEEEEEEDEDDVDRFVNLALLSHIAVKVRDQVPRGTHVKGGIPYQRAFTGRDIVNTIQRLVQRDLMMNLGITSSQDRQIAIQVARSLQSQLFFYEVEWGGHTLTDSVEDVTCSLTTRLRCYSASCT
ncbi:hypothetical protein BKA62DRAFT_807882, partial [Auriculariales sp. MPI-PUGE-AT-0066]